MNFFIVFLLPSVLGIKVFLHLNENKKDWGTILYYLLFVLFSNYFCMIYLAFTRKMEISLIEYAANNYIFAIKYITLTLIINFFLAILFTIIKKYFVFSIEVENGKKKKKNK